LALVHVARGEPVDAARQLDAILALHPGLPTVAVDRAALHLAAGEREAGLALLDGVLAEHPGHERAAEMRATALGEQAVAHDRAENGTNESRDQGADHGGTDGGDE
jgi:hypothetical protein